VTEVEEAVEGAMVEATVEAEVVVEEAMVEAAAVVVAAVAVETNLNDTRFPSLSASLHTVCYTSLQTYVHQYDKK